MIDEKELVKAANGVLSAIYREASYVLEESDVLLTSNEAIGQATVNLALEDFMLEAEQILGTTH